jgi:O-antigen/teichoic acid export membrane protein
MASTQLFGLANMLAIVVGPRLARLFGQTGQRGDVAALAARTIELLAAMLVLPAAVVLVLAPAVVGWLLPQYRAGLPALLWLVPGTVLLGLTLPAAQCLVAVYRERAQLALVGLATLVAAAGTLVAVRCGWGLVGVSAAMTLANVIYFAAVVTLAIRGPLKGRAWRACLVRWALVGLPTLMTAMWITQTTPLGFGPFGFGGTTHYAAVETTWFVLVLRLLLIALIWLATIAAAWCWGGWSQILARGDIAKGSIA